MNDDRAVYRKALIGVAIVAAAITLGGAVIAALVADGHAALAAALGGALAGVAALATPASMIYGRNRPPHVLAALVAGVWLAKMVVLVVVVGAVSRIEDFPREAFGWTLISGVVASLAIDVWAVRSTRVPYTEQDS